MVLLLLQLQLQFCGHHRSPSYPIEVKQPYRSLSTFQNPFTIAHLECLAARRKGHTPCALVYMPFRLVAKTIVGRLYPPGVLVGLLSTGQYDEVVRSASAEGFLKPRLLDASCPVL